ncbi:MAG: hypothetical protein WCT12_20635 [Verrucomicrobiota bacterium]
MNIANLRPKAKRISHLTKLCAVVLLSAAGATTLMAENPTSD